MTAFAIGSYVQITPGFAPSYAIGTTMAFFVLSWASTIDVFNTRTTLSIFKAGLLTNKGVFITAVGCVGLAALLPLFPITREIFSIEQVSYTHWLIIGGLSLMQVFAVEMLKLGLRISDRKKALKEAQ